MLVQAVQFFEQTLAVQNPAAMLHDSATKSQTFEALLIRCIDTAGPPTQEEPWGIILYNDGVGVQPLQHDSRHVEIFYWSIKEFGIELLSCENAWFTITAMRDEICAAVGGVSAVMGILLKRFFFGCHDFRHGIAIELGGAVRLFFL